MYLVLILSLVLVVVAWIFFKAVDHPVMIFSILWLFISLLYVYELFELNEVNDLTVAILCIMLFAFAAGGISIHAYNYHNRAIYNVTDLRNKVFCSGLRELPFWGICAIAIIVMLRDQYEVILQLLNGASFKQIIVAAGGKTTVQITGALNVLLYIFVVNPVKYLVSPVCAIEFFTRKEKRWRYLLVNIIIVALAVVHHGGRNLLITFAICYAFGFYLAGKRVHFKRRTKIMILLMVVVFWALLMIISGSRGIEDIYSSFYAYFVCGIPIMQNNLEQSLFVNNYAGGFLSLNGFFYPIMTLLSAIGVPQPELYSIAQEMRFFIEENLMYIGDYNHAMNAFIPAGGHLYMDGGYWFECLGMFVYGCYCTMQYNKQRKSVLTGEVAKYLLIVVGLCYSFTSFAFVAYGHALGLIYIYLLYSTKKIKLRF